jgi:hypothetical protein
MKRFSILIVNFIDSNQTTATTTFLTRSLLHLLAREVASLRS